MFTAGPFNLDNYGLIMLNNSTGQLQLNIVVGGGGAIIAQTPAVFRDPSAWYHFVVAVDTTQATNSNGVKMYVNGVQQTLTFPAYTQNQLTEFNNTTTHNLGQLATLGDEYFDGYLTEVNFIDGQQLTPSSFGSTNALTGVWQPARYTGTYGTNGFYLPFTDNSALTTSSNVGLGKDFSGNGNFFATNNISITAGVTYDSMTDVPTLTSATAANFAVINPLDKYTTAAPTNGNLTVPASNTAVATVLTSGVGNFYWEINNPSGVTYSAGIAGFVGGQSVVGNVSAVSLTATNVGIRITAASPGSWDYTTNGTTFTVGSASIGTGLISAFFSAGTGVLNINFGQRPFAYTPPTGFVALNTYNLPTSTIVKGNTVMDATLYTGTGASLSVTNTASFKPDFVWTKSRSNATDHKLTDSVRGVTKALASNSTNAETTDTQGLTAFNSNGFTLGTDANYNGSGRTFVGWQWQAGQGSTSSNTNGSITSTVSVNASAGFSVVTFSTPLVYTNATVGHGLGVTPAMFIVKNRNGAANINWNVYHQSLGNTQAIYLNLSNAATTSSTFWNNTSPTSSVFTVGANLYNSSDMVAYCWTPIAGYSAFGSYTGNGSTDGPFVYLGFRPRFILFKATNNAQDWVVYDSARDTYNSVSNYLFPNSSAAEASFANTNFLSNGFKLVSSVSLNYSGYTYIYAAFAENPFKNALAR
jgi:hypothetical protein